MSKQPKWPSSKMPPMQAIEIDTDGTVHDHGIQRGAPGVCFDIDGDWWHTPGSCPQCRPTVPDPRLDAVIAEMQKHDHAPAGVIMRWIKELAAIRDGRQG